MSIIKAAELDMTVGVQSFRLAPPRRTTPVAVPAPDPRDAELETLRARIAGLTADLSARDEAAEAFAGGLKLAHAEGEAAGREAGLKAAESLERERTAALEQGVANAGARLSETLGDLESLALLVAKEGLDKILGDPGAHADLLARAVRKQFAGLRAESVLQIEVSTEDFPNEEVLRGLADKIGRPGLRLDALDSLPRGSCRMRLKLGLIEIGVGRQWAELSGLLTRMAVAEGEP